MKKTKTILHIALLTALSTSAYAQYEQQGYPSRNITTTAVEDRGDFSSDLSQEEAQRNLKGECDSTCNILVPVLPPNPVGSILTNLARATLETESRNLTCQAAGYPANYIGQVSQSRTYTSQNGVPIASSYSAWNTVSNTCTAPAPCSSVNLSWTASGNTCSGTVAAASSGSNSSVSNTAANRTGNATYSCNNGTWTYVSGSCNASAPCPTQSVSWTASGNTCSGTLASVASGSSRTASNTASSRTGSATYSCNNGTWTRTSASCSVVAPPSAPPPSAPPSAPAGTPFTLNALVCGPTHPSWNVIPYMPTDIRYDLINAYRNHPNYWGRCPEVGGWNYWLREVVAWEPTYRTAFDAGYRGAFNNVALRNINIAHTMYTAAQQKATADAECTTEARRLFGPTRTATYVPSSGNRCTLN